MRIARVFFAVRHVLLRSIVVAKRSLVPGGKEKEMYGGQLERWDWDVAQCAEP